MKSDKKKVFENGNWLKSELVKLELAKWKSPK